ncbi:VWA domain-containing protein [Methylobacterium sp. Leaf113]|uniref:VWA domain-containing protein n=1 Tax=Methylobacterium sp. Leaf113 TaxID=1736259 RepID=UPI000A7F9AAC|nr:VWA domain-containing protein [Methylobacterium sp. Leaf113]
MTGLLPQGLTALASAFDLASPYALLLLPLPLLAARLMPAERVGSSGALRVPASLVAEAARGESIAARGRGRAVLIWTLWSALVVALAGPRLVLPATALPASGREIMLAMDLSGSMERRDFALDGQTVTRLAAVKRVGTDFIRRRAGDRIGLVIFANESYVAASPSFDTATVARALDEATIGLVGRSTGIGDGLGLALKRLSPTGAEAGGVPQAEGAPQATAKVVILMTDGANNAGQTTPRDVAGLAKELGIRVHTIALGPRDLSNADGEQDVVDTETLRDIADLTGGRMFRVKTTDDLMAMAEAIDQIEGGRAKAPPVPLRKDLWPWPAALAFLAAAGLLASRRTA